MRLQPVTKCASLFSAEHKALFTCGGSEHGETICLGYAHPLERVLTLVIPFLDTRSMLSSVLRMSAIAGSVADRPVVRLRWTYQLFRSADAHASCKFSPDRVFDPGQLYLVKYFRPGNLV